MKHVFIFFILSLFAIPLLAQDNHLTQSVIGTVLDQQSGNTLPGAVITLIGNDEPTQIAGASDAQGNFRLKNVPIGRQSFRITLVGYLTAFEQNVEVTSAKEVVLEIRVSEDIKSLKEVVVKSDSRKDLPINNDAVVSARQMNMDEATRFSGTRNDPSRMAQSFAGVSGTNDGRNDLVIRGNSPQGVLWVMDGINIPSPNHFSTLGATGGPVSMLNTNTLRSSDFITSAFPAQFGNAVAGVFDLRTRNGNTEKNEFTAQAGFNGFEFGAEGPLNKDNKSSFLVDYRYSLVALIQKAGLSVGTGTATPYYQDGSFKLHFVTKNNGVWDWFGLGGTSHINFPADSANNFYVTNDGSLTNQLAKSTTAVTGLTNTRFYSTNSSGKIYLAASYFLSNFVTQDVVPNVPDKTVDNINDIEGKITLGYTFNTKFNSKNQLTAGVSSEINLLNLQQQYVPNGDSVLRTALNVKSSATLLKAYANYFHRFNNLLSTNFGVYSQFFTLNNTWSVEPRWNLKYQFKENQAFTFGAGLHSQMQPLAVYYYQTQLPDGSTALTNKNLNFVKSLHTVVGYDVNLSDHVRLKTEVYGQYLFGAAVESTPSSFSLLNYGADFGFPDKSNLVNNGKGYNYGLELTLEHFLNEGFYYLITGSLFESKYQGSDGIWRNTAFNTNDVFNVLGGKEFKINEQSSFGLDTKFTVAGGQRYTPFDIPASQAAGYVIFKDDEAYSLRNPPYLRWDVKLSYTRNGKKITQKFYVDFQNVTRKKNLYVRTLDPTDGNVGEVDQLGFFPNVNYQITF